MDKSLSRGKRRQIDPNLFRRKIRDSTTGESRHDLCCDRIKAYISREGLGIEAGKQAVTPMLEPVLNYQVYFPDQVDAHTMLGYMRQIEEEDPMLPGHLE